MNEKNILYHFLQIIFYAIALKLTKGTCNLIFFVIKYNYLIVLAMNYRESATAYFLLFGVCILVYERALGFNDLF